MVPGLGLSRNESWTELEVSREVFSRVRQTHRRSHSDWDCLVRVVALAAPDTCAELNDSPVHFVP